MTESWPSLSSAHVDNGTPTAKQGHWAWRSSSKSYNCKSHSGQCGLQISCNERAKRFNSWKILQVILSPLLKYFALLPIPSHSKTTFSFPSLLLIRLRLHLWFFPKQSNLEQWWWLHSMRYAVYLPSPRVSLGDMYVISVRHYYLITHPMIFSFQYPRPDNIPSNQGMFERGLFAHKKGCVTSESGTAAGGTIRAW